VLILLCFFHRHPKKILILQRVLLR